MNEKTIENLTNSVCKVWGLFGEEALGVAPLSALQKLPGERSQAHLFIISLIKTLGEGSVEKAKELCDSFSPAAGAAFRKALEALDAADFPDAQLLPAGSSAGSSFSREAAAYALAAAWTPEIELEAEAVLPRWKLGDLTENPDPIRPEEVVLQLNGLYTLPMEIPEELPAELAVLGRQVLTDPGKKVADYDHPVPLFEKDAHHELVSCLQMLDRDLSFEKELGVFDSDYRLPVLLSVSSTHENLDGPVSAWIGHLLRRHQFKHVELYLLTEDACRRIDRELFGGKAPQFSVSGPYGKHFTALKYTPLLFESFRGIRASFKLDTDEAILSKELYEATGKSWFQILCHSYWGGSALDHRGSPVYLGVNEGEYVNGSDIEAKGYADALRTPDVRPPEKASGKDIFFQKGYAHGKATSWYNRVDRIEEAISHPVVKGGGYGITNETLKRVAPFTWSRVGRAEDQQFYFSALAAGVRGIFHPDLRIAHYKGAVSASETRTEATRLAGDMYRLVQFEFLVRHFGIKPDLDPMPGVFASSMARAQAFFHLLHRTFAFFLEGKEENGNILLTEAMEGIEMLETLIDSGKGADELEDEQELWTHFVEQAGKMGKSDPKKVKRVLESCLRARIPLDGES